MAATDPSRSEEQRGAGAAGRQAGDPWGVRRAENLLTSLTGVLSARIVVSPLGEVEEVHILTQGGTPPKQVVRNVESALLAHLGLRVDHRKISVAQTAEVRPIEALDQHAVREAARRREMLFGGLEFQSGASARLTMSVTLVMGDEQLTGTAESLDNSRARMQAAARATVVALEHVVTKGTLEVEGVQIVEAFGRRYVMAGVLVAQGRRTSLLTGTCELGDRPEESAALAVLDATNRWFISQR